MKKKYEVRYIVTAVASIPVYKINGKTEAYKLAAKDGWGTVYRDENNALVCDEDCSASLYTKNGGYFGIYPYEEVNTKEMPKQAECAAIIIGDSCGVNFWAEDTSQIHIFVTYEESGLVDTFRVEYGEDAQPYDGETEVAFEDLVAAEAWEEAYRAEIPGTVEYQRKQEAAEVAAQAEVTAAPVKQDTVADNQQETGTAAEAASEGQKAALGTPEVMAGTDATEAAGGQQAAPQAVEINLGKLEAGTRPETGEREPGKQPGGP